MKLYKYKSKVWRIPKQKFKKACDQSISLSEIARQLNIKDEKESSIRKAAIRRIIKENINISHINTILNLKKKKTVIKKVKSIKIHKVDKNGKYICCKCKKVYSKFGIGTHYFLAHQKGQSQLLTIKKQVKYKAWNKGLKLKDSLSLQKASKTLKKRYANGEIIPHSKGKEISLVHKNKISKSMKKAHKEGRAWNIGKSRWNNKPSYPEQFFARVIKNNFKDQKYNKELPIGRYSLDFAWMHLKKCIEIDGEQHQRYKEYKLRDIRKNKFLKKEGWKILRISWKKFYHNPQKYIQIAYNFIHN